MYFVIIIMNTHKVLFTELMSGRPMGFGFRNHWAHAVKDVLGGIEHKFTRWKKLYKQN